MTKTVLVKLLRDRLLNNTRRSSPKKQRNCTSYSHKLWYFPMQVYMLSPTHGLRNESAHFGIKSILS
jgi:hypothetical protein